MFSIQIQGGVPIYEQLYKRIAFLIISGGIAKDERLPAVREIAKELGINPNTVQKTYQMLEQDGLIYSVPAKGSYASGKESFMHIIRKKALERFSQETKEALEQGLTVDELIQQVQKIGGEL